MRECLELALQAPTGGNSQTWHFVIVTDPGVRDGLANCYRRAFALYIESDFSAGHLPVEGKERQDQQQRVMGSAEYLAEHLAEVPMHVIPCIEGRLEGESSFLQASIWGSILPAAWSFMLAARGRGLGTSWTTLHLMFEEEAAALLGIPYSEVTQAALIPVAYTIGDPFKRATREPLERVSHWDRW